MAAGLGDKLASGQKSAQFSVQNERTEFEHSFTFMSKVEICNRYALSEYDYDMYKGMRDEGTPLPDLQPVGQELTVDFEVNDRRSSFISPETKVVPEKVSKFPARKYKPFHTILDRLLVKRINTDPDLEELEDGSARSKRTGLVIAAKYRQHNNKGIVLTVGHFVGIGGQCVPLSTFVKPSDLVTFGSYNLEKFPMEFKQAEKLCNDLGIDHYESDEDFYVVRIQDIRGVEEFES